MRIHESKQITFDDIDYETWKEESEKVLKGAPIETLLTSTYENITIKPLYTKKDVEHLNHLNVLPGVKPYSRGIDSFGYTVKPWLIGQRVEADSLETFNQIVKEDLSMGQTMIHFLVADPDVPSSGLIINTKEDLSIAFSGIPLTEVPVYVNTGANALPFLSSLNEYCIEKRIAIEDLKGTVAMDPLHILAKNSTLPYSIESLYDAMAFTIQWTKKKTPNLRTIIVNSEAYHNGGASAVSELAYSLATATDYLNECIIRGLSIHDVAPQITFSFSVGSHFFMEIAKLRAAKLVWATIVEAFGGNPEDQKMRIHAQTSSYTKTIYDPYVNIIRSTIEAFAGAMGGIESFHVHSFDDLLQQSNRSFSRRIARNTQLILQEEAFLTKVIDPAGGSYYIESLTNEVAEKAYEIFQHVESQGGMLEALKSGFPQKEIERTATKRKRNVDIRKDKIVGTNMYANLTEKPLTKTDEKAGLQLIEAKKITAFEERLKPIFNDLTSSSITLNQITKSIEMEEQPLQIIPIKHHRLTEEFEAIRHISDEYLLKNGQRPKIGLLHLGNIPSSKARADFAIGFFEAGGFELEQSAELYSAQEVLDYVSTLTLSTYVLCGRDELYREMVVEIASKLVGKQLYLVGKPTQADAEKYTKIGIAQFIHQKTNCYETLLSLQLEMGVTQNEEAN